MVVAELTDSLSYMGRCMSLSKYGSRTGTLQRILSVIFEIMDLHNSVFCK